ncbi:palmitoyltransferase, partial [Dimargaris xerosporica]
MQILSLTIFDSTGASIRALAAAYHLDGFSYFKRGSIQEFLTFFSKTVAERTNPGQRQAITQE